jgi:hypothetical protein
MGGRSADAVFWFDPGSLGFRGQGLDDGAAGLVAEFNSTHPLASFRCREWCRLPGPGVDPGKDLPDTGPDDGPCEPPSDRLFPHRLPCGGVDDKAFARALFSTPFLDDLTFDIAEASVERFRLGGDDTPDLLALSLSATDTVGHDFGPASQEVLDQLRRLDLRLGAFLDFLDRSVGKGRWALVLSADHGIVDCPETGAIPGARRVGQSELVARVEARMKERLGPAPSAPGATGRWIAAFYGNEVWLSRSAAYQKVEDAAVEAFRTEPAVERVYRRADLSGESAAPAGAARRADLSGESAAPAEAARRADLSGESASPAGVAIHGPVVQDDPFLALERASWHAGRSSDIALVFPEGWLVADYPTGTNHGTPHGYDSHVALILDGPGLIPGRRAERVAARRAAPTLAAWIGVAAPEALRGDSLLPLPPPPGEPASPNR